jgi:hypothetical protein
LAEADRPVKVRRGHIDVKENHKKVETCEGPKTSQDELPPVFIAIWTLYTTEIV